jgi:hypothetical protein
MIKFSGRSPAYSRKRLTYSTAAIVAAVVYFPFQSNPLSMYIAVCAGYTILVFGLRWAARSSGALARIDKSPSEMALTHLVFLAIALGFVRCAILAAPHLPYFLTTEDSSHPYFGLGFLAVLALMGLEAIEQKWLTAVPESGHPNQENNPLQ